MLGVRVVLYVYKHKENFNLTRFFSSVNSNLDIHFPSNTKLLYRHSI